MNVLVINAGSSSLKYQLMSVEDQEVLAIGICERVGGEGSFHKYGLDGNEHKDEVAINDHDDAISLMLAALIEGPTKAIDSLDQIDAIGHRVVQGGQYYDKSVLIDDDVLDKIGVCSELAPLHNPPALMGINACMKQMPGKPMVAVFDTSFFQTLEPRAYMYALPYELYEKHTVRKYGMHGTSHRYVAGRAAEYLSTPAKDLKVITCHLGNGCSMAAVDGGVAVDTSMGLTPLDGLMMGTRCGSIDPAVVPFVMEHENLSTTEVNNLMNKKSGLLGISGLSNDLRTVTEAAVEGHERAQLALDMYAHVIKRYIGQYMAVMGGVDVVVMTAGVGENSDLMRKMVFDGLEGLGMVLDSEENAKRGGERTISAADSAVKILVIPTNEEYAIARDTYEIVSA